MNISKFKKEALQKKIPLRTFFRRLKKQAPKGMDAIAKQVDEQVWKEIDCLECAHCCKTMTPTFTPKDIKRISAFFKTSPEAFTKQWLKKQEGDMTNKLQPCQFLNADNKCSIYDIRPSDCSGFPHFTKRNMLDYTHVYSANVIHCPASLSFAEKLESIVLEKGLLQKK